LWGNSKTKSGSAGQPFSLFRRLGNSGGLFVIFPNCGYAIALEHLAEHPLRLIIASLNEDSLKLRERS
jgi:hypothetical protein